MAGAAKALEFQAEVKGISTGQKLGADGAGATVVARVSLEGNGTAMPIEKIMRMQKAGLCDITIRPAQGIIPETEED
jgi:hypothetical protein